MRALLRAIGGLLLLALLAVAGLAVAARFADGPVAILPGGPLTSGELVPGPIADWSFAAEVREIELQLLEPPRSRTVWIVVQERAAFIPCGFLDLPLWKQWPHEAVKDGRALVRIAGRRYEVTLQKIEDPALYAAVAKEAGRKYGFGEDAELRPEQVWYFRLDPRSP